MLIFSSLLLGSTSEVGGLLTMSPASDPVFNLLKSLWLFLILLESSSDVKGEHFYRDDYNCSSNIWIT